MASALDLAPVRQLRTRPRQVVVLLAVFGVWTLLVWAGRIRNVFTADDLSGAEQAWRFLLAALFVAAAGNLLVRVWGDRAAIAVRRYADGDERLRVPPALLRAVTLLAALTTVGWLVRTPPIWFGDYDGGFKVVHTVLAVVSIALAVASLWAVAPRSPAGPAHR